MVSYSEFYSYIILLSNKRDRIFQNANWFLRRGTFFKFLDTLNYYATCDVATVCILYTTIVVMVIFARTFDIYHSNIRLYKHGWALNLRIVSVSFEKETTSVKYVQTKIKTKKEGRNQLWHKMTEIEMPMDVVPGTSGITSTNTNDAASHGKQHLPW